MINNSSLVGNIAPKITEENNDNYQFYNNKVIYK